MAEASNTVIDGFGGSLLITDGFGNPEAVKFPALTGAPSDTITDYDARAKALLITEFRQTRDIT